MMEVPHNYKRPVDGSAYQQTICEAMDLFLQPSVYWKGYFSTNLRGTRFCSNFAFSISQEKSAKNKTEVRD